VDNRTEKNSSESTAPEDGTLDESRPPFSFAAELARRFALYQGQMPRAWQYWDWFTDDLPVFWFSSIEDSAQSKKTREVAWIRGDEDQPHEVVTVKQPKHLPVRTYVDPNKEDKDKIGLSPGVVVNSSFCATNGRFIIGFCKSPRGGFLEVADPLIRCVDASCLWSVSRSELVSRIGDRDGPTHVSQKLAGLLKEVLGLKDPTWGRDYEKNRSRTWMQRGDVISFAFRDNEPTVPCVVVSAPATIGDTKNVIVLRTIDYRPEHDTPLGPGLGPPLAVYPITIPDGSPGGLKRSIAIPLVRTLNSANSILPWSPRFRLSNHDMKIIDERLEDILATPHS